MCTNSHLKLGPGTFYLATVELTNSCISRVMITGAGGNLWDQEIWGLAMNQCPTCCDYVTLMPWGVGSESGRLSVSCCEHLPAVNIV